MQKGSGKIIIGIILLFLELISYVGRNELHYAHDWISSPYDLTVWLFANWPLIPGLILFTIGIIQLNRNMPDIVTPTADNSPSSKTTGTTCGLCGQSCDCLTSVTIRDNLGTRYRDVCPECFNTLKENGQLKMKKEK